MTYCNFIQSMGFMYVNEFLLMMQKQKFISSNEVSVKQIKNDIENPPDERYESVTFWATRSLPDKKKIITCYCDALNDSSLWNSINVHTIFSFDLNFFSSFNHWFNALLTNFHEFYACWYFYTAKIHIFLRLFFMLYSHHSLCVTYIAIRQICTRFECLQKYRNDLLAAARKR